MYQSIVSLTSNNVSLPQSTETELVVAELTNANTAEVIEFLNRRPIHTVTMLGFIRDNGIQSKLNRGTFYSCRNRLGRLEGVALIGHAILMETTSDRALEALAEVARTCNNTHVIMGESERIECFWRQYQNGGQRMRVACREFLFELHSPLRGVEKVDGFRAATLADLELVMPVHGQMAFEESGINPMDSDREGFRARYTRRIQQGRTWVVIENGTLIFKADLISETDDVAYIEGVWVNPERRRNKFGLRCMSQLADLLLKSKKSICLLVNEGNTGAHDFYRKAGYEFRGVYDTIFLDPNF
ncbi:MAG TPA: GNAT family N-acetyltransferase [Pyrinomonadaceae bacterium]|jgi:predicted GNAT family acetyltransferase